MREYNTPPYTQDKPNFAINISILIHNDHYLKLFGAEFLKEILFLLDQEAFTGIFESKKEHNDKEIEFLYNYIIPKFKPLILTNKYIISNSDTLESIRKSQYNPTKIQLHRDDRKFQPYAKGILTKRKNKKKKQKEKTKKQKQKEKRKKKKEKKEKKKKTKSN